MPSVRSVLAVVVIAALCAGCANKSKRPVVKKPPKPWIGTRSLCIFPMAEPPVPGEPQSLERAMTEGWRKRMKVPDGANLVRIEGARSDTVIGSMFIDLSDVAIDYDRDQKKLRPKKHVYDSLHVANFVFVANPLVLEKSRMILGMTVADARLDLRSDRRGRPMLTLTDARDGTLTLEVPKEDVDALLLYAARKMAGQYGVSIDRTHLEVDIIEDRAIKIDLKIDTRLGFLPAGLRFKSRIDIDDQLNGTIARLDCEGDQVLGPLISMIVDPVLASYEGKKRPLVGFEWGDIKLRDVTMNSDDGFRLEAKFGSAPPANKPATVARRAKKRAA